MYKEDILKLYNSPSRFYHNLNHIMHLNSLAKGENDEVLENAILFHDAVCNPRKDDNEENSCKLWKMYASMNNLKHIEEEVSKLILSTKDHLNNDNKLIKYDLDDLLHCSQYSIAKSEELIFKEYQYLDIKKYILSRCALLSKFNKKFKSNIVKSRIEHILDKKYSVGVFLGSFDPFHIGHLDILTKAEKMFDKIVICQGQNSSKKQNDFKLPNSVSNRQIISGFENVCDIHKQLNNDFSELFFVRGIRNSFDLQKEEEYAFYLQKAIPNANICHILCSENTKYISSSNIRELQRVGIESKEFLVQ